MQYALLIFTGPDSMDGLSGAERDAISDEYMAIGREAGIVGGEQLQPVESA
jgi:hypothetical protein